MNLSKSGSSKPRNFKSSFLVLGLQPIRCWSAATGKISRQIWRVVIIPIGLSVPLLQLIGAPQAFLFTQLKQRNDRPRKETINHCQFRCEEETRIITRHRRTHPHPFSLDAWLTAVYSLRRMRNLRPGRRCCYETSLIWGKSSLSAWAPSMNTFHRKRSPARITLPKLLCPRLTCPCTWLALQVATRRSRSQLRKARPSMWPLTTLGSLSTSSILTRIRLWLKRAGPICLLQWVWEWRPAPTISNMVLRKIKTDQGLSKADWEV